MTPAPRDGTISLGTMGLEDSSRLDFGRLRQNRRRRVFDQMDTHDLDALILGRPNNVRYVSGARQLWRAGVFTFAPMCVVVRQTNRIHLLSTWDEGIPPEIFQEDLFGLSWNPMTLATSVSGIPGLSSARRIGLDGQTPLFAGILPGVLGHAELVDGGAALAAARRTKTPDEITCITIAEATAEAALSELQYAIRPGISEKELVGVHAAALAHLGTPTPGSESVVFATPSEGPVRFRYLATHRPIGDGELVVLAPSALYAGYEAGLARTVCAGRTPPAGTAELKERCERGLDALLSACVPGNSGGDLCAAWDTTGSPLPDVVLAHGLGLGAEPPVIGLGTGADDRLEEGMVLMLQSWVVEEGTGGWLERATVHISVDGPILITPRRDDQGS